MLKVPKHRDPQVRPISKVIKSDKDIWTIAVKFDSQKVDKQSRYPDIPDHIRTKKQFCYGRREKNHYTCAHGSPVYTFTDSAPGQNRIYSQKITALPTFNGFLFDSDRINTEMCIKRKINWVGFTHTEQKDHRLHKFMLNERKMFDVTFFGITTGNNLFYTRPIRDPVTGLIHRDSCKPIFVKSGTLGTISLFPFDYKLSQKLKKSGLNHLTEFGKTEENLRNEGWLLKPECYDPTTVDWYNHWYGTLHSGRGMPMEIRQNQRLIPIFHEVCSKYDVNNPMDGSPYSLEHYLHNTLDLMLRINYTGVHGLKNPNEISVQEKIEYHKILRKVVKTFTTDHKFKNEYIKIADFRNRETVDFKVLGGPKEQNIVPFGAEMQMQVMMASSN